MGKICTIPTEDLEKILLTIEVIMMKRKKNQVLPSQYPNILVNGAGGIAVGMATSIPPHNLGEIINGTIAFMNNKDINLSINETCSGPDFPTGGVIIGKDIIKQGYNKKEGSFKIRGEIDLEEKRWKRNIEY